VCGSCRRPAVEGEGKRLACSGLQPFWYTGKLYVFCIVTSKHLSKQWPQNMFVSKSKYNFSGELEIILIFLDSVIISMSMVGLVE
jgi:hypothetical protein